MTPGHIDPVLAPVVRIDVEGGPGDHARQHGEVDLIPVESIVLEKTGEEVSRYVNARGAPKSLGVFESDGLDESALPQVPAGVQGRLEPASREQIPRGPGEGEVAGDAGE